jgi:UDPglucose 6-dehydrogenase
MNDYQCDRFVQRVVSRLEDSLSDKKIVIFGWAFKKGTSDSRESCSINVLKALLKQSVKTVAIFDPRCNPADIRNEVSSMAILNSQESSRPDSSVMAHDDPYTAC